MNAYDAEVRDFLKARRTTCIRVGDNNGRLLYEDWNPSSEADLSANFAAHYQELSALAGQLGCEDLQEATRSVRLPVEYVSRDVILVLTLWAAFDLPGLFPLVDKTTYVVLKGSKAADVVALAEATIARVEAMDRGR